VWAVPKNWWCKLSIIKVIKLFPLFCWNGERSWLQLTLEYSKRLVLSISFCFVWLYSVFEYVKLVVIFRYFQTHLSILLPLVFALERHYSYFPSSVSLLYFILFIVVTVLEHSCLSLLTVFSLGRWHMRKSHFHCTWASLWFWGNSLLSTKRYNTFWPLLCIRLQEYMDILARYSFYLSKKSFWACFGNIWGIDQIRSRFTV
jgi:hypothetical protein